MSPNQIWLSCLKEEVIRIEKHSEGNPCADKGKPCADNFLRFGGILED